MKKSFAPLQFDLPVFWLRSRRELMKMPKIQMALQKLQNYWNSMSEMKYESAMELDEEYAKEEYLLDLHTGQVKIRDYFWLRETFEGINLGELSLAIAEEIMPDKIWELLENDEDAVVTDLERSIVIDFKYGRELSGAASLLMVEDTKFPVPEKAEREISAWMDARRDVERQRLSKMQKLLDDNDYPGRLIEFPVKPPGTTETV